jgi:hypothetical protein
MNLYSFPYPASFSPISVRQSGGAHQNERLTVLYYKGRDSLDDIDYRDIARQVGLYRKLSSYVDDLGEDLDELLF